MLMWVYEFTCTKCREVFVCSLGPGRAVRCPACGSSALDARLDPLSELILLLVTAASPTSTVAADETTDSRGRRTVSVRDVVGDPRVRPK